MKKKLLIIAGALAIGAALFFGVAPVVVERACNRVRQRPPYAASDRARQLDQRLFIADLHADSLLWGRNLLDRSSRGHVDVPRLLDAHVGLQVFTTVTKVPRTLSYERNADSAMDLITPLAVADGWPPRTWGSYKQRALYQAAQLHDFANRSGGKLVVITSQQDLQRLSDARAQRAEVVGGVLGMEGAYPLEGDVPNLDDLYRAGFRIVGLAHFYDNEFAGSAHGEHKGGLSPKGEELVRAAEQRGMIIDLAHASAKTINDVLAMAKRPPIVSHTGLRAVCRNSRNLSDEQLQNIAFHGGLIGIGYWEAATCGKDAEAVARSIRHAVDVAGIEHVALGSDFDGAVTAPFDVTGLPQITDALLAEGFSEDQIAMIMGGNVLRFFQKWLPEK